MYEGYLVLKALFYGAMSILLRNLGSKKGDEFFWSLKDKVEEEYNRKYPEFPVG